MRATVVDVDEVVATGIVVEVEPATLGMMSTEPEELPEPAEPGDCPLVALYVTQSDSENSPAPDAFTAAIRNRKVIPINFSLLMVCVYVGRAEFVIGQS